MQTITESTDPVPGYQLSLLPGHVSPGRLERLLRRGEFSVTAELDPPDSADPEEVYKRSLVFAGYVDAINATDGSGANCHMSSVAVCALLARLGYAIVMQISCRDKNRIAIQGDILGGAAMGVCNVLCLSGDGVQAGDHPQSKPVFDLDCMSLLSIAKQMRDQSSFQSGRKLTSAPRVMLGAAANPFIEPLPWRALRTVKKIQAGADFIQTQYCYDVERLKTYLQLLDEFGVLDKVFILVGVGPLRSAKVAQWMREHVPGVYIPDAVIKRMQSASNQALEGRNICVEIIQQVKELKGVAGVHIMAYRQEQSVPEIVERSGVLKGRQPWHPNLGATHDLYTPLPLQMQSSP